MICLDSSFIIDLLKKKPDAIETFQSIKSDFPATTLINIYEMVSGIYKIKDKKYEEHIQVFEILLEDIKVLGIDNASVFKAAKICSELSNQGELIEDLDILIAGICLSNGCTSIVTKNVKHFSRIKGLKVEAY